MKDGKPRDLDGRYIQTESGSTGMGQFGRPGMALRYPHLITFEKVLFQSWPRYVKFAAVLAECFGFLSKSKE
jgi:hypothetical protein